MVCLGNICRSPLAEGILRSKLPDSFVVDSAGTISMHEGETPDKRAVKTAANHHIDISKQKSRPIQMTDFDQFDKIYCMDLKNLEDVISLTKTEEQRQKVHLFLEEAGNHQNSEVPDPYWGNLDDFEKVYQLLDRASNKISHQLQQQVITNKIG